MDLEASGRQIGGAGNRRLHIDDDGPQAAKKNDLKPHLNEYWKIPPERSAEFVAAMEAVLEVYRRAYNPKFPVVCMDESPKQLLMNVHAPLPAKPGMVAKTDEEYIRHGVAEIFLAIEPLTGFFKVNVTERRTRIEWAHFVKELVDEVYPDAKEVTLVMDNLNTHNEASLYEAYTPEEARRIASRIRIVHTPKHGSWLNIAEIGLSILKRQAVPERVATIEELRETIAAFVAKRNAEYKNIDWQFTTADARIKLKRLYPKL